MHRSSLDILVDPITKAPLRLDVHQHGADRSILEGVLHGSEGRTYAVTNGVPRFVLTTDSGQRQTESSFGFKWQQRNTYDSPDVLAVFQRWVVERYGFTTVDEMRGFFSSRQRILDAGCGGGLSASVWMNPTWQSEQSSQWYGVDISAAIDVARERLEHIPGTEFIQADILQLPFREHTFDTIFSEGVLHHTPSTELAFQSLVSLLEPGGELLCYMYRKKGAVREFTDDYIRELLAALPPQEAWEKLRPLTKLGQALAELHVEVEVPEDIPYLDIQAGRYDVQRLIYWHFAKLFWNTQLSFEENHHVNFDWYHPRYAHRHTEDEIRRWCCEAGLAITHLDVQESGFTVRAKRG